MTLGHHHGVGPSLVLQPSETCCNLQRIYEIRSPPLRCRVGCPDPFPKFMSAPPRRLPDAPRRRTRRSSALVHLLLLPVTAALTNPKAPPVPAATPNPYTPNLLRTVLRIPPSAPTALARDGCVVLRQLLPPASVPPPLLHSWRCSCRSEEQGVEAELAVAAAISCTLLGAAALYAAPPARAPHAPPIYSCSPDERLSLLAATTRPVAASAAAPRRTNTSPSPACARATHRALPTPCPTATHRALPTFPRSTADSLHRVRHRPARRRPARRPRPRPPPAPAALAAARPGAPSDGRAGGGDAAPRPRAQQLLGLLLGPPTVHWTVHAVHSRSVHC